MHRTAVHEGLLVGVLTFLVLTIVFSILDIGATELTGFALIGLAAGVVTVRRDRPSSAAPGP